MFKYWLLMLTGTIVAVVAQMLLKKAASIKYPNIIREYLNVYVILGYGLMLSSSLFAVLAYKGLDYKNGAVIESLGYVFVLILSRIIFKEAITKNKIIGNLLIIAGVIIFVL